MVDCCVLRVLRTKIVAIILSGESYDTRVIVHPKDLELNGGYTKLCEISVAVDLEIRVTALFSLRCPKGIIEISLIGAAKPRSAVSVMLIN